MPSSRLFNIISWLVTSVIVFSLLGFTFWRLQIPASSPEQEPPPTQIPTVEDQTSLSLTGLLPPMMVGISRLVSMETTLPEQTRYTPLDYTVNRGDSVFGIAKQYNIKPESLLWANYDVLQDSPDSIRVGQKLKIPPTDGVFYQWQAGDTLDAIATKFEANVDDILAWPGNDIDLTNPEIKAGSYVMVPGGKREFVQWIIPTVARGKSGTASVASTACGDGPIGSGAFVWPADNHYLSGNDYWSGHLGIDISAGEGAQVYAADSGVVTMAQGGWNYGYGNVIMIDHGNGYITLYAHLSTISVAVCQSVYTSNPIAFAGNTGNSFGAHLHFEVRLNGGFVNPWYILP